MGKAKIDNDRIVIDLQNGNRLVLERNRDPMFEKEVYVMLENADGM